MKKIVNLTQHPATLEQVAQGVVDMPPHALSLLKGALTFNGPSEWGHGAIPTSGEIRDRASFIAGLALSEVPDAMAAMIGGAGYLMGALEKALRAEGIQPLHAFSTRESVETPGKDGEMVKVSVFLHLGWVEV
jgi:hypothetical protein